MRKFRFSAILFSILAIFLSVLFLTPNKVTAACNPSASTKINLGDCLTLSNGQTVGSTYDKPAVLVNLIVSNIFIVAGFILLIMVIYSGFLFISGGQKGIDQAKTVLTSALMGFVIMFTAYWILRIIAIVTGADILF